MEAEISNLFYSFSGTLIKKDILLIKLSIRYDIVFLFFEGVENELSGKQIVQNNQKVYKIISNNSPFTNELFPTII